MKKVQTITVKVKGQQERGPRLVFGKGNAKLGKGVKTFSLPAGWACPFAEQCLSKADRQTGKIKDGRKTRFRCFSASDEARHKAARASRWHNFELLRGRTIMEMVHLIMASMPRNVKVVRIHVSGDFFSLAYLDAWLEVARRMPNVRFYFYTKSIRHWVKRLGEIGTGFNPGKVVNFVPTASYGGKDDELIAQYGLRSAIVVYSEQEAAEKGLAIDHDDSHAMNHGGDFALLIHGMQPPGSEASKAISSLRAQGEYGYGKAADKVRKRVGRTPLMMVN